MKTTTSIGILFCTIFLFLFNTLIYSQKTYAVVVGISDYQDPDIPDLKYSDKDAIQFNEFLKSEAGGKVAEANIKMMLNEEATMAKFAVALDWLWEVVKEGDLVYIYFSGHGDVEKKSLTQPGYLLCWDAPSKVYMAGGTFGLSMLQEVLSTLSIQNKAKVTFIADACRSGTLSGSSVGGAQITGTNLAKQFSNEIKILSCQPSEYSIEGVQWGGGRGAFSYHLLNGLYGMADKDESFTVDLREIRNYLEDNVSKEVAPEKQMPMTVGSSAENLFNVYPDLLEKAKADKAQEGVTISATETRGIEEDILALNAAEIRSYYKEFKKALLDKRFFTPTEHCADYYFDLLKDVPEMNTLVSSMRRNYAAELQDDAQQTVNNNLKSYIGRSYVPKAKRKVNFLGAARQIERAAQLLGKDHYMYEVLEARKLFIEGYVLTVDYQNCTWEEGNRAMNNFRRALQHQASMPQTYMAMSQVYGHVLSEPDSALHYANLASEESPTWLLPYTYPAFMLSNKYNRLPEAKTYLEKAEKIDSKSLIVKNSWGSYYFAKEEYPTARNKYQEALDIADNFLPARSNLGLTYFELKDYKNAITSFETCLKQDDSQLTVINNLALSYLSLDKDKLAEKYFKRTLKLNPDNVGALSGLAQIDLKQGNFEEAEKKYLKVIERNPDNIEALNNIANVYFNRKDYNKAGSYYQQCIQIKPDYFQANFNLGNVYDLLNKYEKAEKQFLKCLELQPDNTKVKSRLGAIKLKQGNLSEAENYTSSALSSGGEDINTLFNSGVIAEQKGDYKKAENIFRQCITQRPNDYNSTLSLAQLCAKLKNYNEAAIYYNKCLEIRPNEITVLSNLGQVWMRSKKLAKAEASFKEVLELDANNSYARCNLGIIALKQNKHKQAIEQFNKVLKNEPENTLALKNLGSALINTNQILKAETTYEKLVKIDPTNKDGYHMLARINAAQKKNKVALKYLEQALKNGYNNKKQLESDSAFMILKKDKKWNQLLKKYFN